MLKDVDPFEGSRVTDNLVDEDEDNEQSMILDEHQLLATAEDWGTNPQSTKEFVPRDPIPHTSPKHTFQTLGQRTRKPRDRHDYSPPARRRVRREYDDDDDGDNGDDPFESQQQNTRPLSPSTLTSSRREVLDRYFSPLPGGTITRSVKSVPGLY